MPKTLPILIWFCAAALLATGCQRNLIYLNTPQGNALGPSATPDRNAVIESASGTVEWRASANADWVAVQEGQVLSQGAEIRTGVDSRATLRLTEGSKIYVGGSSEVAFNLLNPYLDSQLTVLDLAVGQLWVLLNGGSLDVETPLGTATARTAYLSLDYRPQGQYLDVTCLQGVCGFGTVLIPSGYKLVDAQDNTSTEPMELADFGVWGVNVPEATAIASLATEAIAQGSATLPVVATLTPSRTPVPTQTAAASPALMSTDTPIPAPTDTAVPDQPTAAPPSATPVPPSPTPVVLPSTSTPRPFTPLPPAPIIGTHTVLSGETIFCLGRAYGVLPGAIAQANGLQSPFTVYPGQVLRIPQIQWFSISAGPVCAPQFLSPFPGLVMPTATTAATATPSGPPLTIQLNFNCIANCGSDTGSYVVRVEASASGGIAPYTFNPAQTYDVTIPHCTNSSGTVSVTSADNQFASMPWFFDDVNC